MQRLELWQMAKMVLKQSVKAHGPLVLPCTSTQFVILNNIVLVQMTVMQGVLCNACILNFIGLLHVAVL